MRRLPASTLVCLVLLYGTPHASHGQAVDTIRTTAVPHDALIDARGLGVDPAGLLYVADAGRDVVVKMDADGRLLATIGGPGSQQGEFDDPSGVDPTNGLVLFVADAGNRRIQIFSRSNAYLGSLPLGRSGRESAARATYRRQDGELDGISSGIPVSVATSASNEVFAVDANHRAVIKWNENRRQADVIGGVDGGRGTLGDPVDLWVGPEATLYVADRGAGVVTVYDLYGTFVRAIGSGLLTDARAVTVASDTIFVALDRTVLLYDRSGRLLRRLEVDMPASIVDLVAGQDGSLFALSSERVYRLRTSP